MTKDEILAMEPGRELDCWVAEKVMGWINVNKETGTGDKPNYHGFYGVKIPNFSTDIAAAWEIVEHMRSHQRYLTMYNLPKNNKYLVEFIPQLTWENPAVDHSLGCCSLNPAEAIVKAALLAVMNDE